MKELFEKWVLAQFGEDRRNMISNIDGVYVDDIVNAMWIGFNAHAALTS